MAEMDDLLDEARADTEKEIFGGATSDEEITDDTTGEGLTEGDEPEVDEDELEEDETEAEPGDDPAPTTDDTTTTPPGKQPNEPAAADGQDKRHRVPVAELTGERQKRQAAEAEIKSVREAAEAKERDFNAKLDLMVQQMAALQRGGQPQQPVTAPEQPKVPDLFGDPEGFVTHLTGTFKQEIAAVKLQNSLELAAMRHGDLYKEADAAIGQLDQRDPSARALVQRLLQSPQPGEAMVAWYREQKALREIGNDPNAWKEQQKAALEAELREKLLADPTIQAQIIERARGSASQAKNTLIDPPRKGLPSLNGTSGRSGQADVRVQSDSDRDVFDSIFAS